jgi:hypothetical protein
LTLHSLTDPDAQQDLSRELNPTVIIASHENINLITQIIVAYRRESSMSIFRLRRNRSKLASGRLPKGLHSLRELVSENLRLVYISAEPGRKPIAGHDLDFLRAGLGARVIYALGSSSAFGPVAQTHLHDYRGTSCSAHFGPPIGGVEIKLTDLDDSGPVGGKFGELQMNGPVVAGEGWVHTGLKGKWRNDGCLEVHY